MKIYIICTVRIATQEQLAETKRYAEKLRSEGIDVFYPPEDAPQSDPTGEQIVKMEVEAIRSADRIDVFWHNDSKGSHFDLGVAVGLGKPIKLIKAWTVPIYPNKQYPEALGLLADYRISGSV